MRITLILAVLLVTGCGDSRTREFREYVIKGGQDEEVYLGSDANAAYVSKLNLLNYVENLQAEGVQGVVPYPVFYIWTYARLGLLADHLGKKAEASRYFRLASGYARKFDPAGGESKTSEAALQLALDQMDTPDKVAWRRK
jgi:hypothetical protein